MNLMSVVAAFSLGMAVTAAAVAGEVSLPVDCLPDHVADWQAAAPDPDLRFGAGQLPGIVLGPPGPSSASTGATSVASLGNGGSATLVFDDLVIEDGPGPDFIIFENAFFVGAPPADELSDFFIFAEPATVEVSMDGVTWTAFSFDAAALAATAGSLVDRDLFARLRGLAGVTPTFTGNWTVPDDPQVWDSAGTGGVSGAGGDAFDLADVGLSEARFVRVTDAGSANGPAGSGEGFDLDSVVVLHGRPLPPAGADTDGDGLSDLAEQNLYGTVASDMDSDGDGVDDGRELAGCRDPSSSAVTPWVGPEPRLVALGESCTGFRWTYPGGGRTAGLLRGLVSAASPLAAMVDLGVITCLAADLTINTWSCDGDAPPVGEAFFYLVVLNGGGLGWSSGLLPRAAAGSCP